MRDSPFGGKQESVDVEAEELAAGEHRLAAPVGIRLTIYSKRADEEEAQASGSGVATGEFTPMASDCTSWRSCVRRATMAILERWIWSDILRRREFA